MQKIGLVVMPIISVGGGFPRTIRDLISALNSMGKEVHLLTPFEVDMDKIAELYGPIKIDKIYNVGKIKSLFCREEILGRKLLINKFKKMANEVDFIIDTDGCVLHNYLPENFDKSNYVIWRISCLNTATWKLQNYINMKMIIKKIMKKILLRKKDIPYEVKIYPVDEWGRKEIIKCWKIQPQKLCLYSEIKTDEFRINKKKKDIIVVLGRIAPNKSIVDSVKIFYYGTKKFPQYKLIIIGGTTPDTENYLKEINEIINHFGIKNRVEIIRDPPFSKIIDILAESKIGMGSQIGISMNMPIVEAMASGCIALMRKCGGTYEEVLENGKYGSGFDTVEEGSKELEKILENLKKGKINNKSAIKRAEFFSSKNFRWRLKKILDKKG